LCEWTRFRIADFGLRIVYDGDHFSSWLITIHYKLEANKMTPEKMKQRTKSFAIRTVRVVENLPAKRSADVIGRQLLRCGTSVGANYRAACRARSAAEFRAKLGICEEEADEPIFWLERLPNSAMCAPIS
jgi:four helix bundle protein